MPGLTEDNLVVNALWLGGDLSCMEQLTAASFMFHGHTFRLWHYYPVGCVPEGVELRDAREVLPEEEVFYTSIGKAPGSPANFSDLFRFRCIYLFGGWYVDMDVACLQPFQWRAPYVFRHHPGTLITANILKAPPRRTVMKMAYEGARAVPYTDHHWNRYFIPLVTAVADLELGKYVVGSPYFEDDWSQWILPKRGKRNEPYEEARGVHWSHAWLHKHGFDKRRPVPTSLYDRLLREYGLHPGDPQEEQTE